MRGLDAMSGSLFSYVDIEARIPTGHPIRIIRHIVNEVLAGLDADIARKFLKGIIELLSATDLKTMCVTPHVAQKVKGSAIDNRTTRHLGYDVGQKQRKIIEEAFGWAKLSAGSLVPGSRASPARASSSPSRWQPLVRLPRLLGALTS
jgi:hypothetical protein